MTKEQAPAAISKADAYDERLEHLVDSRGISYDDARRELGPPPYELYEVPLPAATEVSRGALKKASTRRRRRRSGHGPQYGEEEGVGYPDGKPHYYQPYVPLSSEQAERNATNIAAIREELEKRRSSDDEA